MNVLVLIFDFEYILWTIYIYIHLLKDFIRKICWFSSNINTYFITSTLPVVSFARLQVIVRTNFSATLEQPFPCIKDLSRVSILFKLHWLSNCSLHLHPEYARILPVTKTTFRMYETKQWEWDDYVVLFNNEMAKYGTTWSQHVPEILKG
jgi:hypothetical protein